MTFLGTKLSNANSPQTFLRRISVSLVFPHEDSPVYTVVSDTTVDSSSRFSFSDIPEDLILQNVTLGVINITPGVGWTLMASCPLGATGTYVVSVIISEVN